MERWSINSVPDVQNDVELAFDMLASNPLSEGDKEASEYLEFTYIKDNEGGHQIAIYNPITEQETILKEVRNG